MSIHAHGDCSYCTWFYRKSLYLSANNVSEITAPAHKTAMLLRSIAQQCQQCQILGWLFNMCIFNFCSENLDMSWTFFLVFFLCMFSEVVLIIPNHTSLCLALVNIFPLWHASFCDDANWKASGFSTIYSIILLLLDVSSPLHFCCYI